MLNCSLLSAKTCVLLKHCAEFDGNCTTCKTGIRPLYQPSTEQAVVLVGGSIDNPNFKKEGLTEMYSEITFNQTELIINGTFNCELTKVGLDELLSPAMPENLNGQFGHTANTY